MTGAACMSRLIHPSGRPVRRVHAQLLARKPAPAPLDTVSAIYEFANGASASSAPCGRRRNTGESTSSARTARQRPLRNELVLHGAAPRRLSLEPVDSLRAELEMFANAIEARAAFPISVAQMLATVAAFESYNQILESDATVILD